jgi:hypothetical protein
VVRVRKEIMNRGICIVAQMYVGIKNEERKKE